jgi:hypothetical protein
MLEMVREPRGVADGCDESVNAIPDQFRDAAPDVTDDRDYPHRHGLQQAYGKTFERGREQECVVIHEAS